MPYVQDRVIHDADAHVMETPDWVDEFAPRSIVDFVHKNFHADGLAAATEEIAEARRLHADEEFRSTDERDVMLRKNWRAIGSSDAADRSQALDHMGFASQLIFPTVFNTMIEALEGHSDDQLTYAVAEAANAAQIAFCSQDPRLLPVAYVPLANLELAGACAQASIAAGAAALLIPNRCPRNHAPSHVGLNGVYAAAQEAGIPVLLHVSTPELVMPPQHRNNGLPREADFHGGGENFTSVSYMGISAPPMQTLSMLIFDGVLDRFPALKVGVIELGAVWVPGFMRQLDAAMAAFGRHERRLGNLSLTPSDYVRRQIRVTPYPTEPTGWIVAEAGDEICMFSSDYPHVEGGRNPLRHFDQALANASEPTKDRFFRTNFEDLMGTALPSSAP